ncbi:MAG: hypothetical protein JW870_21540, partial [Candidatus Delongbacteria bacterium]|nr:hypothetical protein [Candidatus Delongbacteria bacterium]
EIDQIMTTRFLSVDPMARKYPEMNPYGYCANNPINAIDPDGREILYLVRNNDGAVTNTYRYTKGNFYDISTKKMYDPDKGSYSTLNRLTKSYQAIENSNDNLLKGRLHHLESSEKYHYIEKGEDSGVRPLGGGHTQTTYNFKDANDGDYKNIGRSDVGTTAHELQHQYDWDTDNMKDNAPDASATDPAEIRAVATENKARNIDNKEHRTSYHREKIDPEKLKNPPNYK